MLPISEQWLHFTESVHSLYANPAQTLEDMMAQSKSWANYDREDDCPVSEGEDSASLFKDDDVPPTYCYPLDDLSGLLNSAVGRMETQLLSQSLAKTPSKEFTTGLLTQPHA